MTVDEDKKPLGYSRVHRIGRHKYAFGLFWQTPNIESPSPKDTQREAKELAKDPNISADLYVIRKEAELQFGLGSAMDGLIPKSIAAAAVAASKIKGSWMGVFSTEHGYWFISVREDYITPHGDAYYDNEIDAKNRLEEEIRIGDWQTIYAPKSFRIDGTKELLIHELLADTKTPVLQEVNPLQKRMKFIVFGTLALGILLTSAWWYKQTTEEEIENQTRNQIQNQIQQITEPEKIKKTPPWFETPKPKIVFDKCKEAILKLPTTAPGYELIEIQCRNQQAIATFNRINGIASWFNAWMEDSNLPNISYATNATGEKADIIFMMENLTNRGPEGIYSKLEVLNSLSQASQTLDDGLQMENPRIPQAPVGADPETYPIPEYAPSAIRIQTKQPDTWFNYLSNFPGLIVTNIVYDNNLWTIQGDIYVRL